MTEKNLENVSHEEAVAALKCTSDRVVLVVAKSDAPLTAPLPLPPPLSQSSINLSHHHPLPASPTPPPSSRKTLLSTLFMRHCSGRSSFPDCLTRPPSMQKRFHFLYTPDMPSVSSSLSLTFFILNTSYNFYKCRKIGPGYFFNILCRVRL